MSPERRPEQSNDRNHEHERDPKSHSWVLEEVYTSSQKYFDSLIQGIQSAQSTISLESYIFGDPEDDEISRTVLDALKKASDLGITVRVLVDGIGSSDLGRHFFEGLAERTLIESRIHAPLFWLSRLNRRNHRKVCLIDDKYAWLGSLNIWQEHLKWLEVGVKVQGEDLKELRHTFEHSWSKAWTPVFQSRLAAVDPDYERHSSKKSKLSKKRSWTTLNSWFKHGLIRSNHTQILRTGIYRDLIRRIRTAKTRVWLTSPYIVPRGSLIRALKAASRRGVNVSLLAPADPDVHFLKYVSPVFYEELLKHGVQVFLLRDQMIHAKFVLIDNWVTVGSTNLNYRSLLHDLEVDAVMTHEKSISEIETLFTECLRSTAPLSLTKLKRTPLWQRLLGRLLLLFKRIF